MNFFIIITLICNDTYSYTDINMNIIIIEQILLYMNNFIYLYVYPSIKIITTQIIVRIK